MSESINVKTEMGDHQLETRPCGDSVSLASVLSVIE